MVTIHTKQSFFFWYSDDDGDIGLRIAWIFHFTKYKQHTIFTIGRPNFGAAGKYQGKCEVEDDRTNCYH